MAAVTAALPGTPDPHLGQLILHAGAGMIQISRPNAWDERYRRRNFEMTPSNHTGRRKRVASLNEFPCPTAAAFSNGHVIAVDGGWRATRFLNAEALKANRNPYS